MRSRLFLIGFIAMTGAISPGAYATNGYFMHGYGIKSQGQAGATVADPQDGLAAATNPAGTVWVGNRFDVGATLFSPRRNSSISGSANPGSNGSYSGNNRDIFVFPEFGYTQQLSDQWGIGLAIYANGGMNTGYKHNLFGGKGHAGVDLEQLFITPSVAYKFTPTQSVGIGLNFLYQRFQAEGLQAFDSAGYTSHQGNVTNRGHDTSTGVGLRLGWQGEFFDRLRLAVAWASKINASKFHRYSGLFANNGSFDVPENYSAGLSFDVTPKLTLDADVQEIKYGDIKSIANTFDIYRLASGNTLGSASGPGFGWKNVTVYKFGGRYQLTPELTLRGGYSHATQPIRNGQTYFNMLAPGIIQDHASVGLTWDPTQNNELSLAYTRGFSKTIHGHDSIPSALGGGESTIKMSENIFGISYAWKF